MRSADSGGRVLSVSVNGDVVLIRSKENRILCLLFNWLVRRSNPLLAQFWLYPCVPAAGNPFLCRCSGVPSPVKNEPACHDFVSRRRNAPKNQSLFFKMGP